jgi:hypothetical protein
MPKIMSFAISAIALAGAIVALVILPASTSMF